MTTGLTVLYDARCPMCRQAARWVGGQQTLVRLDVVPAGSAEARRRLPMLDHDSALVDVTVVADDGSTWRGDAAWITCLWATARYRGLACRLAEPAWRPTTRRVVEAVAGLRGATGSAVAEAYGDACGRCRT